MALPRTAPPSAPPTRAGHRSRRPSRRLAVAATTVLASALGLVGTVAATAPATAAPGGPGDTGPQLRVSAAQVDAATTCSGDPRRGPEPVLLVHGTTQTGDHTWGWTWQRALSARGTAWCSVELPGMGMGEIPLAAEYVVGAVRSLHARAERRIGVVGHSQGGMVPRWALKYWPDTRAMVADVVGLSPSNHGTLDAHVVCQPGIGCAPAFWQQRADSRFIATLNAGGETYPGIDYTSVRTRFDEVVVPSTSAYLTPGPGASSSAVTNVAVQDLCPLRVVEHLGITADGTAYALGIDALTHDGPADVARVRATGASCLNPYVPGVSPTEVPGRTGIQLADAGKAVARTPFVPYEPALPAYAG